MYKDTDKQKEANRIAAQKRRDKTKGTREGMTIEEGMTPKGMTNQGMTPVIEQVSVTPFIRSRIGGCKVAIPGDEDYTGACYQVDGVWKVRQDIEPTPLKDMTRQELERAIRAYPNDQWINSAEHKELMRRLTTWSIEKLEGFGYFIPAWKKSA